MAIAEKRLTTDRENLFYATVLNHLGFIHLKQGRLPLAESQLNQALAIADKLLPPDHPSKAFVLNNLGALYEAQHRKKEAEESYLRALSLRERLGSDHPNVAITLMDLAGLYKWLGRYDDAEQLLKRAQRIRQLTFGENHPYFAAEDERERIVKRANDGRRVARTKGVKFGRKPKLTAYQQQEARKRLQAGDSARSIAKFLGVNHATVLRSRCLPPLPQHVEQIR